MYAADIRRVVVEERCDFVAVAAGQIQLLVEFALDRAVVSCFVEMGGMRVAIVYVPSDTDGSLRVKTGFSSGLAANVVQDATRVADNQVRDQLFVGGVVLRCGAGQEKIVVRVEERSHVALDVKTKALEMAERLEDMAGDDENVFFGGHGGGSLARVTVLAIPDARRAELAWLFSANLGGSAVMRPTPATLAATFWMSAACASFAAVPEAAAVNAAIGARLFADDSLWDDAAGDAAKRLALPMESKTSSDESYRSYPREDERFLGAQPRSAALFGEAGKVSGISVVFANKGDGVISSREAQSISATRERKEQIRDYKKGIQADKAALRAALTSLFGEPVADRFGQSRGGGEPVQRWDWKGHAFMLASPRDEYVSLRVVPVAVADSGGKSRVPDAEMRQLLAARVERRANGDVVLSDIPMVDQGPKGYCVPATWERVMRYMGVPADMYVLAMAAETGAGGGTSLESISAAAKAAIAASGRRSSIPPIKAKVSDVAPFIDRGVPLIWSMSSTDAFNDAVNARLKDRAAATDPAAWSKLLEPARKAARSLSVDREQGHVCLITGYNKKTGELCVSDSWGPAFRERWATEEEAKGVSYGDFFVIEP